MRRCVILSAAVDFAAPRLRNASVIKCDGNVTLPHAMQAYRSSRSTALNLGTKAEFKWSTLRSGRFNPTEQEVGVGWAAKPV